MNYYIKRDLNEYGPYSLADLQRYVSAGNILLTDMTRSEGMTDWVPVSQVIGTIPVAAPALRTQPAAPAIFYPEPPSLHWGIVLALGFITCGLFGWVWAFVQAGFVKKIDPSSKALLYYSIGVAGLVLAIVMNVSRQFVPLAGLIQLTGGILFIVGAFSMKGSLEEHYNSAEPIGLTLSGVMTFFFNIYYFQYHLTRIAEAKKAPTAEYGSGSMISIRAQFALIVAAASAALSTLYFFPPSVFHIYPACPIYSLLHIACPGCGATRAMSALLHGELSQAIRFNALLIFALPLMLGYAGNCRRSLREDRWSFPPLPGWAAQSLVALTLIFMVARNTSHLVSR